MLGKGWIEATWSVSENNRRAKYCGLTPEGRRESERTTMGWERYADAVFKVLRTGARGR
jgi:DNA-binding PadR family transcriptional regulator